MHVKVVTISAVPFGTGVRVYGLGTDNKVYLWRSAMWVTVP